MTIRNINVSSTAAIATSKLAVDAGITSSHLTATMKQGYVALALGDGRLFDSTNTLGAILSTATAPTLNVISTGNSSVSMPTIQWSTAIVIGVIWPGANLPPDFSTVDGITVHVYTSKSSNGDTACTFELAAITPAAYSTFTSSKLDFTAAADLQIKISSANCPAANTPIAIRLTPGAHATDLIRVHGVSMTYTRV